MRCQDLARSRLPTRAHPSRPGRHGRERAVRGAYFLGRAAPAGGRQVFSGAGETDNLVFSSMDFTCWDVFSCSARSLCQQQGLQLQCTSAPNFSCLVRNVAVRGYAGEGSRILNVSSRNSPSVRLWARHRLPRKLSSCVLDIGEGKAQSARCRNCRLLSKAIQKAKWLVPAILVWDISAVLGNLFTRQP